MWKYRKGSEGGFCCLKKWSMWDCKALEELPPGICTLKALEELKSKGWKSFKKIPEGLVWLICPKIMNMNDCWNMHSQGSGAFRFEWMQIRDKNTRGVGGVDLFEEIIYVGL